MRGLDLFSGIGGISFALRPAPSAGSLHEAHGLMKKTVTYPPHVIPMYYRFRQEIPPHVKSVYSEIIVDVHDDGHLEIAGVFWDESPSALLSWIEPCKKPSPTPAT